MGKYLHSASSIMIEIQANIDNCCYALSKGIVDEKLRNAASRLYKRIRVPELTCSPHEITHVENKISFLKRILERVIHEPNSL